MHHLTYVQAVFTGIVQGVTELFPISSLGHSVLLPALIGGSWGQNLSVSAPGSPYLAFVVGLHVATAIAMIVYFRRDWVRIVKGFINSVRNRRITTADERLAWMIVLATIPVGIVGAALQKVFTSVFAKPTLTAFFLAVNGVILLYCERQRRARSSVEGGAPAGRLAPDGGYSQGGGYTEGGYYNGGGYRDGGYRGGGYDDGGYSQQPQQQQWQGPYGDQEPPRPSFTPHSQPPSGGGGRDPRQGRDAGGDEWSQWYSRDDGPRQQPSYEAGPASYEAGPEYDAVGHGRDARYDRGPGYDGGPGRGGREYGGPDYGGSEYRGPDYGGPEYRGAPGYEQTMQYDRAAGYDPRYGGQRQAAYEDERQVQQYDEESAVAADERLSRMTFGRAIFVGAAQILALLPGISRDGIVTVAGMNKGLKREDAVRFSFLLSAPVILAAGVLKASDLFGPEGKGIHGPVLVGSIFAGVGAYLSVRFLTKYFSESRSLKPFGLYCLIFGIASMAYLMVK